MNKTTNPIVRLSHVCQVKDALQGLIETALKVNDREWANAIERAATNKPTDSGVHAQRAIESISNCFDVCVAELTRILCIVESNQPPSERLKLIHFFASKLRDQVHEQIHPVLTGKLANVSWIITGNHPTREISVADMIERNEPRWLVGFQRGFERLELLVVGDGLCEDDASEAAEEFLRAKHPDAVKEQEDEIYVTRV